MPRSHLCERFDVVAIAQYARQYSRPGFVCSVNYIAPWVAEILDYNINYVYNFSLVVGTLASIQAYAHDKHAAGADATLLPHYDFVASKSRAHCTYAGGLNDSGWPVPPTGIAVTLDDAAGVVLGPITSWLAQDAPVVRVKGSWPAGAVTTIAVAYVLEGSSDPCADCFVTAQSSGSGALEDIAFQLNVSTSYKGRLSRLLVRPSAAVGQPGRTASIQSISAGTG